MVVLSRCGLPMAHVQSLIPRSRTVSQRISQLYRAANGDGTSIRLRNGAQRSWLSFTSTPSFHEGSPVQVRVRQQLDPSQFPTVYREAASLQAERRKLYKTDLSVGFVPTMGALHEGHLNLVRYALRENTHVFVSIFVNPTQFAVNEDLDAYPKTWDEDLKKLEGLEKEQRPLLLTQNPKICGIFAPTVQTMYPTLPPTSDPDGDGSFVTITPLGKWLEGASRPIFFRGVATVCTKLFNVVQPDNVYFGQKDVQQSVLIKRMVKDFLLPTNVRVIPTSREKDGLALSSRNVYLGQRRRNDAVVLSKALLNAQDLYNSGMYSAKAVRQAALETFTKTVGTRDGQMSGSGRIEIDYIALTEADDMRPIHDEAHINPHNGAILSAAIKMYPVEEVIHEEEKGQRLVRLIDNVILEPRMQ